MAIPIGTDISEGVVVVAYTRPPTNSGGASVSNGSNTRGSVGSATVNKTAVIGAAVRRYLPKLASILSAEV